MHVRGTGCLVAVLFFALDFARADAISVSSPAFAAGKPIPAANSYHGRNVAPELKIGGVPAAAKSLVLIVDDPDSPTGLWTHWMVWNLPAGTTSLSAGHLPPGAVQGRNSFGHVRYDGPVPPSGTHRYFFRVYALDATLDVAAGSDRKALETAMAGHVIGEGEIFGTYAATP